MVARGIMVCASRQHAGKTTASLAIMSGLLKRFDRVGFIKPVGQRHVPTSSGQRVDKDVILFREYFNLKTCDYANMSPLVLPRGYTRRFLDGEYSEENQINVIKRSFEQISSTNEFVVCEGTGHCGVGSIVGMDNARVAALLGLDIIFVVNGGLGSAFDELSLNRVLCDLHGVRIKGVLVNKVRPAKLEMIKKYFGQALKQYNIPLIGVVSDLPYLSQPTMLDFEQIFKTKTICGKPESKLWHFDETILVAMGLRRFMDRLYHNQHSNTLFVTHASRIDVVLALISHGMTHEERWGAPWKSGLILAGDNLINNYVPASSTNPSALAPSLLNLLKDHVNPVLHADMSTYNAMLNLTNYTAKLSAVDRSRTTKAINHYEKEIDFNILLT